MDQNIFTKVDENDVVFRLRKRAEIRSQIATRKSVQEGQPDRISELLIEAANEIETLRKEKMSNSKVCYICGSTRNLHYDGIWHGWKCDAPDCFEL